MLDVVGIVQHHDGITGTGKQHTADDYVSRIFKGINEANPVYSDVIDRIAQTAGFESADWKWCNRQNGTWTDCPVSDFTDSAIYTTMVASTHNPSNLAL